MTKSTSSWGRGERNQALGDLGQVKHLQPSLRTALASLVQQGRGRGGLRQETRLLACSLPAGSSESAHAEIKLVLNPAAAREMRDASPRGGGGSSPGACSWLFTPGRAPGPWDAQQPGQRGPPASARSVSLELSAGALEHLPWHPPQHPLPPILMPKGRRDGAWPKSHTDLGWAREPGSWSCLRHEPLAWL